MDSAAALSQKTTKRQFRSRQVFFLVCAAGWLFFVFSSLEYKDRAWFPILISGRILLLISALIFCVTTWLRASLWNNLEFIFLLACLAFQALCGILEGGNSTDFTNFMSVFVIIAPVFHKASERNWAFKFFPLICVITSLPFFFKSSEFFSSVGAFTNQFSAIVASTIISFLIGRATAAKNEALNHAKQLENELTQERDQQKQVIERQARELAEVSVTKRIAQATQMVAHDVRRPFSMLRAAIELIRRSKTPEQIVEKATSLIGDVENSLNSVDNLIDDILAISRQQPLNTEPVKLEDILQQALYDLGKQYPEAEIEFDFILRHTHPIEADRNKILRVIYNILTNAAQAMKDKGVITFSTSNVILAGRDCVEISIHNSGPPIPAQDLEQVFDSFFTQGKHKGTGLGLAIAKTFIDAHGFTINCESSEDNGVRFYFYLGATSETYTPQKPILNAIPTQRTATTNTAINQVKPSNGLTCNILIIEDEFLFQQGLLNEIEHLNTTGFKLTASIAANAYEAQALLKTFTPDLILLDLDLGIDSPNGLELLKDLRANGVESFVCIHTNRTFIDFDKSLQELGADSVIPKPMTSDNLVIIISNAMKKKQLHQKRPRIAVIDDEQFYLSAWAQTMTDAEVIQFNDPELFWDAVIDKPEVLASISCFIFDFYLRGTDMDKLKLVRSLRSREFAGSIILSTNANYNNNSNEPQDRFDLVIDKQAMTFAELQNILNTNTTKGT